MTTIYMNSVCFGFHDRLRNLHYDISLSYNHSRSDLNKKVSVDDILLAVGSASSCPICSLAILIVHFRRYYKTDSRFISAIPSITTNEWWSLVDYAKAYSWVSQNVFGFQCVMTGSEDDIDFGIIVIKNKPNWSLMRTSIFLDR